MQQLFRLVFATIILLTGGYDAMATEEAAYQVMNADGIFELRRYEPQILAETIVDSSLEDAGNKAFRTLFQYISGENSSRSGIAMTAPVAQSAAGEKIAMTAPVGQQRSAGKWAVSFTMPAKFSLETLPLPRDPAINIRQVPARTVAAVRYSGGWSEERYLEFKEKLESWIRGRGLEVTGEPVWARYNPPFTLWFLRRNEILIPVTSTPGK